MYSILKNVIISGDFNLDSMLTKIQTMWAQSRINEEEMEELTGLARGNAKVSNDLDFKDLVLQHDQMIRDLFLAVADLKAGTGDNSVVDGVDEKDVPEFVVGKTYYADDIVKFNNKLYVCIAPAGAVCVWSPADYPIYWEELTD